MKVLFFIFNYDPSTGGHYHSLNSISRELSASVSVGIITIGTKPSPVFDDNPLLEEHIEYAATEGYFRFLGNVNRVIKRLSPDVIHCFDTKTLSMITPVVAFKKVKLILNKCGGPNPVRDRWVYCKNIIFFSLENFEWFTNCSYYHKSKLYLIPNRVSKIDLNGFENLLPVKDNTKFNIVRISRVSSYYWYTMQLSVNLAAYCNNFRPTRLYLIGRVYQNEILENLKEYAKEKGVDLVVITDSRANIASRMLYLADVVVGTGRSIMEAMSLSIPVFAPASNAALPVKITKSNLANFFKMNFSERVVVNDQMIKDNMAGIHDLLVSPAEYQKSCDYSGLVFYEYFDVQNVSERYINVYRNAESKRHLYLFSRNLLYIIKDTFS
jgi:glycosyltransferase involved in cell wall biosynthesis